MAPGLRVDAVEAVTLNRVICDGECMVAVPSNVLTELLEIAVDARRAPTPFMVLAGVVLLEAAPDRFDRLCAPLRPAPDTPGPFELEVTAKAEALRAWAALLETTDG